MRRIIVEPAALSGAALTDLKNWLAISRSNEDELLMSLLQSSLVMCEAFTNQSPLTQIVEERLPPRSGRHMLRSLPITSLVSAEILVPMANRATLDADKFAMEFGPSGDATFELFESVAGQAIAVRIRAGIAGTWETVPAALKQGIIRLAAFHYRDRDRSGAAASDGEPPASVTALWRPWRSLRLR